MDLSKYKSLFISESQEHLDAMTQNLLALEKNPSETETIEELFRHAHSIKGMASSMGYTPIETLSHRIEDLMDDVRKGRSAASQDLIDILFSGHDYLERMVKEVAEKEEPTFEGTDDVIKNIEYFRKEKLEESKKAPTPPAISKPKKPPAAKKEDFGDIEGELVAPPVEKPEPPQPVRAMSTMLPDWPDDHLKKAEPGPEKKFLIRAKMNMDSEAPAARAFLALKRIANLGKMVSEPTIDEVKAGKFEGKLSIQLTTDSELKKITASLDGLSDIKEYEIESLEKAPEEAPAAPAGEGGAAVSYELPHTLKVETKSLDKFVNMVGELLTVKSGLRDLARNIDQPELHSRLDRLEALIHELHSQVMGIRMMPIESITMRFPRVVRDLAKQAHKEVEFQLSGQDVELDRAILERLVDPLIHLIRNSIDHGVEPPQNREALRKPRAGKITLAAFREKDHVVIEVSDDGKGIDIEVLKESAIAKGVISAEEAETMTQDEALMLICIPGFSTAEQVTFISGRGVGMDIVKSSIESLGGTLRIHTQLGLGTRTTLLLPRTVAIMNVLMVKLEPQTFAVPIAKLIRTIEITKEDFQQSQKGRMVIFDNEPIPVYNLRSLLKLAGETNNRNAFPALVVEHGKKRFALLVDDFMGQEEAFIRPLARPLNRITGLAGTMTRGDGKPVFVLDVGNLV